MTRTPLTGPSVWEGKDISNSTRWIRALTPDQVDELEAALKDAGKTYEFHRYDDAGHAFFSVDRTAYRPEAAVDGWQRIFGWFGRYLAGD